MIKFKDEEVTNQKGRTQAFTGEMVRVEIVRNVCVTRALGGNAAKPGSLTKFKNGENTIIFRIFTKNCFVGDLKFILSLFRSWKLSAVDTSTLAKDFINKPDRIQSNLI